MPRIDTLDTICAIATPPGFGGIGVVRLSGPRSHEILRGLWRGKVSVSDFKPRHLYLGEVINDEKKRGIDRVLAAYMPAPSTYTGEDVVELSAHGSPVILRRILNACVSLGARPAQPGEFTRRAFLAGKLDLAQAEGVADLIAATSERAARLASDQLAGHLSKAVLKLGDTLANLRSELEVFIDFSEEETSALDRVAYSTRLKSLIKHLDALRSSFSEGRILREGMRVAIVGCPNVGKSSILNRLAGRESAIVHHEPGTTRDIIEEVIAINGLAVRLRDTAGIRNTAGEVEALGIERTRQEMQLADIVLAIFDGSKPWDENDEEVLSALDYSKTIALINKSDLPQEMDAQLITNHISVPSSIFVSALTGEGFAELSQRLFSAASFPCRTEDGVIIGNARHKMLLDSASQNLAKAFDSFENKEPSEFTAQHLSLTQEALGQITGAVTTDDLLNRIFSRFCIGK